MPVELLISYVVIMLVNVINECY